MTSTASTKHTASSIAETVRTFLRLLERGDIDSWMELWAEDADHYYPYGTEMFPAHLVGKPAIYARWKDTPAMFEVLRFPIQEIFTDGDTAIARFDSDSVLKAGRRKYLNTYVCIFKFDKSGKLHEYHEYFDPIRAGEGFGLAEVRYLDPTGSAAPNGTPTDTGRVAQNPDAANGSQGAVQSPADAVQVHRAADGGLRAQITVSITLDPPGDN